MKKKVIIVIISLVQKKKNFLLSFISYKYVFIIKSRHVICIKKKENPSNFNQIVFV